MLEAVIDPRKLTVDDLLLMANTRCAAARAERPDPSVGDSLDLIRLQLADGDALTPAQRQLVMALVRTMCDVLSLEPAAGERETTATLGGAIARLTTLDSELTRMLVRHAAHVETLDRILDGLLRDAEQPSSGALATAPSGLPSYATQRRTDLPHPVQAIGVGEAALAVEEAAASLQEVLTAPASTATVVNRRTADDAFRWLVELACTPPATVQDVPPRAPLGPEPWRLAIIVRALCPALAAPAEPIAVEPALTDRQFEPDTSEHAASSPEQSFQSGPAPMIEHRHLLTWLLAPVRQDAKLAQATPAPRTPPAPLTPTAPAPSRALAEWIERIQALIEHSEVDVPAIPRVVLGELRGVLERPPFAMPLDVPDNLDTVRWLWIAAYLHGSAQRSQRSARRSRRPACQRCGDTLMHLRGGFTCPTCG